MKKIFSVFAIAALFVAAISCSKEINDPEDNENTQEEEIVAPEEPEQPGEEDDTPVPEGMIRLRFAVSHEGDAEAEDDEAKTSWDGNTHSWINGDPIRIIWGEGNVEGTDYVDATVSVSGNDVTVTANVLEAENYYAVYPTTATYALDLSAGKITITVPRYQSGSFEDANIMAAKTSKVAAALNFKNMTSILKFTTGSTYNYDSVSFMANDQTKLTGTVATTFPAEFAVETANGSDAIVCIQKGNPSGNAGVSANTTYYLAMLPGASIDNGIGFKIETRNGSNVNLIGGGISKTSFARDRSKVFDLTRSATLDARIVTDWYISEAGTGNGASEATPAGPERLMDLLNPSYSTNLTTAGWRLTGATIHIEAGTYNLQSLNGGTVFELPHYNLSNNKIHIKGEGTSANPTVFVCNGADGDHILSLTTNHKVGELTFENIKFTAANSMASNGIAFCYTPSADVADNHITFKDCIFSGLTSTTNSGTYGGAAVFVYSAKVYDLSFDGCIFSDNTAARGGAVALANAGADSKVSFTGCEFSNNAAAAASSNQGGAVYVYANGHTSFDACIFSGDGSTSTAANGGAIAIIKGASVTLQNGCSFSNLKTGGSGGAIFNHGTLVADGTTFSGCQAKLGGAIHTDGEATIGSTSACTFTSNKAAQNGGSVHFQKTSSGADSPTLTVSNSSFSGNGEASNAAKGGAIAATSTSFEYTVTNCSFSNLVAANGGAIHNVGIGTVNSGSTFTACDVSENGGAIYNGGTITIDGCTITGKGKGAIMNALLGGGIYNAADASCMVQNSSTIEECALDAGSTHAGAGIWNAGTLTVSSSVLKNNACGYRGGAIYCTGTVTLNKAEFNGNNADNGGGIHTIAGTDCYIEGCTFTANTATNGAAIRTEGKSGSVAKLVVINSLFKENVPSTKSGNNGGAVQVTSNYSYSVIANSTFTTTDGTALATGGASGDNVPTFYLLSCTFADNTIADFDRNFNKGWFYNTICASADFAASRDNLKKAQYYSIFGSNRFEAGGTTTAAATVTNLGKNCLGTYNNGVYPLVTDATYSAHYSEGMSVADLQALTFTNITLTNEQKALLAKDQKGNPREGTIMGAYVLTTAPSN